MDIINKYFYLIIIILFFSYGLYSTYAAQKQSYFINNKISKLIKENVDFIIQGDTILIKLKKND